VRVTDDPADVWAAALDDGSGSGEIYTRARFGDADGRR